MKTTISGCKSRFSLTQNVFFNNLFFYNVFDYKCSWIQVIVLAPHLHPELIEGCRRMQHNLWAASTSSATHASVALMSSAAKFKHPNTLHRTCILSLSKDVEGCNIAYGRLRRPQPPNLSASTSFPTSVALTGSAEKFKHPNALHRT